MTATEGMEPDASRLREDEPREPLDGTFVPTPDGARIDVTADVPHTTPDSGLSVTAPPASGAGDPRAGSDDTPPVVSATRPAQAGAEAPPASVAPAEPTATAQTTAHAEPAVTAQTAAAAEPAGAQAAEHTAAVRAAAPAQTAQPAAPAQTAQPAAPAQTAQPAAPARPTLWQRFAAAQSRALGAVVERLIRVTGGECATVHGLRVCREGRLRLHAKGGTQLGDTFVTALDPARVRRGLVAHESHHRDAQWRRYGLVFGVMYLYAHLRDVVIGKQCCNRYEMAAELASNGGGGYDCLPPPARRRA